MKLLALFAVLALGVAVSRAEDNPALAQARKEFSRADAELNGVYKAAIAELDKARAVQLRDDERDWISYRDRMLTRSFPKENNPESLPEYWKALASYARERAGFVSAWSGKHVEPGITGKYSNSSLSGELDLKERKDGVEFFLSVVGEGVRRDLGQINGTLKFKGDTAYFKNKLEEGADQPPCELAFTFIEGHIIKVEEKVPAFPGKGISLSGTFYKIGKFTIPDEEGNEVVPQAAASSPAPSPVAVAAATTPAPVEKPAPAESKQSPAPTPKQFFVDAQMNPNGPTPEQARKKFETVDALLNKAYKEASAELDKAKVAELRVKQRDWLSYRDMMAESAPFFNSGDQTDAPKKTADYWVTMADMTSERIEFLRAYSGKKVPQGITGEYSDSYGGTLELEERKSGVAFTINTVRSRARNEGSIDGIAQRNGDKLVFKDHPAAGDDRPPCEITMTLSEGHIVKIEEKNGDFYHGFNANFDGMYYKTGKLKGL